MPNKPEDFIAKLTSAPLPSKPGERRDTYQLTDEQRDQMRRSMLMPVFKMVKVLYEKFDAPDDVGGIEDSEDRESIHVTLLKDVLELYAKVNRLKQLEETRIVNAMIPRPDCHYYSWFDVNHFVMSAVGYVLAGYDEDDISEIENPQEVTAPCEFLNSFVLADRAAQAAFTLSDLLLAAEEGCVGPASYAEETRNHLNLY